MEKTKKVKLYFHDTRSKVETPKDNHLPQLTKPLEGKRESSPPRINKWSLEPMNEDSTTRESSPPTS